ncbi:hypothetical protein [Reyranella sp.]|uniref:hypothetical protein n=1 Tax=Reyranella sp. TaxID=1929291 RepID=UPI003783A5AB
MSSVRKLRRDFASADLAAVEGMLSRLTDEDAVTRMSLEDRKKEIEAELAELPVDEEHHAQAAVFFGGRPVVGSLGIESEFAGRAVSMIQDLVAKQFARESETGLGQRGPLPNKGVTRLHVTDVLRGSFGFLLEELQSQSQLLDTSLKTALDQVMELSSAFAEMDEERFEAAVDNVDERVLKDVRDFFSYLSQEGATLRLIAGNADKPFDDHAVARAARRAVTTTVSDKDEEIVGRLTGVLPEGHLFEFRCDGPRAVIRGKVSRSLSAADAARLAADWVDKSAVGNFLVRQVVKEGRVQREAFTLRSIQPRGQPTQGSG